MFPAATFAQNVVHYGIFFFFQFVLGLATFSNGFSRYAGLGLYSGLPELGLFG